MIELLKKQSGMARTENGAAAYATTLSDCLDLFATVGALRHATDNEIRARFIRAFIEDRDKAMKILFFARDVRCGLGERRVFRSVLKWLAENETASVVKNIKYMAEFGRYDDLLTLIGTPAEGEMLAYLKSQLDADLQAMEQGGEVTLLAKWLPSINASSPETVAMAKRVSAAFEMNKAEYRKTLSALRGYIRIIENDLRKRDYTFDYGKQPSKAMMKYRKAFLRNDGERYAAYLDKVINGEAKLHADTVAPYELVEPYIHGGAEFHIDPAEKAALNATWKSLPDFGNGENMLPVIDTSGSMYYYYTPTPAAVALSLGLYIAERNSGAFRNCFIEFSGHPRLIELKGDNFVDKLRYIMSFSEIANTDLSAVFNLILGAAVVGGLPQSELPSKLVIISDMQFDYCVDNVDATVFEDAKAKFEANGYKLPEVVFWNVNGKLSRQPVQMNEQGVALVSGCNANLFSKVAGGLASPYEIMMDVLSSRRYESITA